MTASYNLSCFALLLNILGYVHPFSSPQAMLKHLLCPQVDFPGKAVPGKATPQIFCKECCTGNCDACAAFRGSDDCLLNCPLLFNETRHYKWKEYGPVMLDNKKEIKELKVISGTLEQFRNKFEDSFTKYRKHYYTYKWLNLTRANDLECLDPNDIFIQTDYSAQPTLDSQDKLNSVGHGVCVLSCWVVIHSPRQEYYMHKGEKKYYTFYESDHIRVVTPSTGKQKDQDWFLHCKVFDMLIKKYKEANPLLHTVIIWTDGAPNQYKCRQNFYWITQVLGKHGVYLIHRFAATAQFKGIHDKIGQIAKWIVA